MCIAERGFFNSSSARADFSRLTRILRPSCLSPTNNTPRLAQPVNGNPPFVSTKTPAHEKRLRPPHTAQEKQDESRREAALLRLLLTGRPQCVQCMLLAGPRTVNSAGNQQTLKVVLPSAVRAWQDRGSENDLPAYAQPTRLALLGRMVKREKEKNNNNKKVRKGGNAIGLLFLPTRHEKKRREWLTFARATRFLFWFCLVAPHSNRR